MSSEVSDDVAGLAPETRWDGLGPPPLALFAQEQVRAVAEYATSRWRRRILLRTAPRGDGHPVLVLPGFLAPELSTAPLRAFLRALAYDARSWKLGVNRGPSDAVRVGLEARLRHLAERHGRKVSLVGWSLGGIYARELARAHPEEVRCVITLATPFRDITATHAVRLVPLRPDGRSLLEAHALRAALRRPLPVPTTSIYSRTDGIVHWRSCLEEPGPQRENVEVSCSHTGMGFHLDAYKVIADRLAQPE
ncbi:MAG: alpha/beta hydrolase, partial [Myxococcota bacterium]|nr:alpha/beta hydrolase [Myxococcota bacterium]